MTCDMLPVRGADLVICFETEDGRVCPACSTREAAHMGPIWRPTLQSAFTWDDSTECSYEGGRTCVSCGDVLGDAVASAWWED